MPNNALSTCRLYVPNLILSPSVFGNPTTGVVPAAIYPIYKTSESNNGNPRGIKTRRRDDIRFTNEGRSISQEISDAI